MGSEVNTNMDFWGKLVAKAEELAGADATKDGEYTKGNKSEEYYIGELLNQAAERGDISMNDAEQIADTWGLQLSDKVKTAKTVNSDDITNPALTRSPRRAGSNITINININVSVVVNAMADHESQDFSDLIKEMTKEGGSVEAFIIALIQKFRTNPELDLSKLEKFIKDLIDSAVKNLKDSNDAQTKALKDELAAAEKRISDLIKDQMSKAFGYLRSLGMGIGSLYYLVNTNNKKQMEKLQTIYEMLFKLKNDFGLEAIKNDKRYLDIINKFANLDANDKNILGKLEVLYRMLEKLQKTADSNGSGIKENNRILNQLLEKSGDILAAIDEIDIDVNIEGYDDTYIREALANILTWQAEKGAEKEDIDTALQQFKDTVQDLKKFISDTVGGAKQEILDAIKDLNIEDIRKLLQTIDGKQDQQLANQQSMILTLGTLVNNVQTLNGKADEIKKVVDEILKIVSKLHNCDCEHVDWDAVWEKVENLLKTYQCCCGENHEGVIDELDELINGARGVASMFPDDETTGVNDPKAYENNKGPKKTLKNGKIIIDGKFDVGGRRIR